MAISRRKGAEKYITNPSAKLVRETLDNSTIPTWNPSKNYQKCAMLVHNRTAAGGMGVNTYQSSYFLMEGQKRFTVAGYQTSYNIAGYATGEALAVEPVLVQNNPPLALDEYFVDACMGYICLYAVTNKGNVYTGGYNDYGNLGSNDVTMRYSLTKVTSTAGGVQFGPGGVQAVKVFSTGWSGYTGNTVYVLDSEGKIYGCGFNTQYQLGDGTTTQRNAFQRIGSLENITTLFTGGHYAFALRNDGNLYVWGDNANGQLGVGDTTARTTPVLSATGVKKAVTMDNSTYKNAHILKTDGTVWFTGYSGSNGVSGLGTATQHTTWQQVTINLSTRNVVDIVSNGHGGESRSTWALIDDGSIYSWGYNGYGQLGHSATTAQGSPNLLVQPTGFPKVDKILSFGSASEYGFKAVNMASGRMFTVGNWCNGAIGISKDEASGTWPIEDPTTNRAHYPAREVESPQPVRQGYATIKDIVAMSTANSDLTRVFCLLSDGTVWAKGSNTRGEMGTRYTMTYYTDGVNTVSFQWGNTRWNPTWQQIDF
jgi:alpha-tubulin suppressor-like RCC1 family protein